MLIHGFDSSLLEFRYVTKKLTDAGLRVEAMEWWTGGFTAREPFTAALAEGGHEPWELIREHQLAFWKQQCNGQKVTLLGASLGGAVALELPTVVKDAGRRLVVPRVLYVVASRLERLDHHVRVLDLDDGVVRAVVCPDWHL